MNMFLRLSKKIYRLLPEGFRRSTIIAQIKAPIMRSGLFPHDFVYDEVYFTTTTREAAIRSAPIMAQSIVRDLAPHRVIDVGCGNGALLDSLRSLNCHVYGLEYAEAALLQCKARGLDVQKFDLEKDELTMGRTYDVVISTEVAEHLPERTAGRYLDLLTGLGNIVVFTAAPPGQGGIDHVNEQPPEYWISGFAERGFMLNRTLANQWKNEWQRSGKVEWWYYSNLMVFRRATSNGIHSNEIVQTDDLSR